MTLHREYQQIEDQTVRFTISFNRDTRNWATGEAKKIGYQVSATPVKIKDLGNGIKMEEFGAFTGFNDCLLEIDRQSSKRLEKSISNLKEKMPVYIEWFKKRFEQEKKEEKNLFA